MIRCPQCLLPMRVVRHGNVELDVCQTCRGVWFDRGELAQVERQRTDLPAGDQPRWYQPLTQRCPHCEVTLTRIPYLNGQPIYVDLCPRCKGMHVSRRDLQRLRGLDRQREGVAAPPDAAPTPEFAEVAAHYDAQTDRELGVLDWVFQLATQLPVEINVPARRTPIVTWTLVAANVAAFLLALAGGLELATNRWGLVPAEFNAGAAQLTLLTSMFMHGGWIHLIGNMYFLAILGDNVEDYLGHAWFAVFYLLGGVIASLGYVGLHEASATPLVGASGAVSAVIGAYLIACPRAKLTFMFVIMQFKMSAFWYLAIWVGLQVISLMAGVPGVAFEAHLIGFAFGCASFWGLRELHTRRVPAA